MNYLNFRTLLGAGCALLTAVGAASAGGLERAGYNIDLLFDPSPVTGEITGTYVNPQRKLNGVVDTDPSDGIGSDGIGGGVTDGVRDTEGYFNPRFGLKAGFGEHFDCLFDYSQPWGAHSNPGAGWAGANSNIETKMESDSYGATCSYKLQMGKGQFRVLGGAFYQEIEGFKERLVAPVPAVAGSGVGRLDLSDNGAGWRFGAAYEIPEIAFRASLVYNSEVKLDDITGTVDVTEVPGFGTVIPVFSESRLPQSVEFKLQSGIAPGWLAFGSVKWLDWSVLQTVDFCAEAIRGVLPCEHQAEAGVNGFVTSLDLLYRDGWTVSGGVGHKFNDQWSAAANLTWDRGTSTGVGYQTDTWTLGAGVSYTPRANVELRLAGALGVLTGGSSGEVVRDGFIFGDDVSYSFDDDLVSGISGTFKVKW
jgi:long-chain fatty acid transport protein